MFASTLVAFIMISCTSSKIGFLWITLCDWGILALIYTITFFVNRDFFQTLADYSPFLVVSAIYGN